MSKTKNAFRLPRIPLVSGRTKLVWLLVVAVLVWLVIQNPTGAAHVVSTVVHGIATFISSLH